MIKALQDIIIKRRFEYKLIQREGNIAIYSQSFEDEIIAYETIVIKVGPPHPQSKEDYTSIELYPSENQFGINGWSYANNGDLSVALQKAQVKFKQLIDSYGTAST